MVEGFDPGEATFHDPHCVRLCPSNPDRLCQQNHCGIYRLDRQAAVGVYFGTTSGELWLSRRDEGRQWECLARHLPEIYAVEVGEVAELG